MFMRVLVTVTGAALAALLLLAPRSVAGVYHVYSCRIPYGAEVGDVAAVQEAEGEGVPGKWTHVTSGSALYGDGCASNGAMVAALPGGAIHSDNDVSTWTFSTPGGETITKARLWRAGDADGGNGYLFWLSTPTNSPASHAFTDESSFDGCAYAGGCITGIGNTAEPLAVENKVEVPAANLGGSHLYINASCSSASCPSNSGDEQGHAVVVYVYAADIALEEQTSPTVGELSGELDGGEPLSGTASLFFKASDPGSGVYKETVSVDGKAIESRVVDETELCKEVPVPAEDGPAFLSAQPCPASANGHVSLDTSQLSNGSHHLLVEVTDAAGNATTVLSKTIEVANGSSSTGGQSQQGTGGQAGPAAGQTGAGQAAGPQSNGTPASGQASLTASWVAAHRARLGDADTLLTGDFGQAETIAGRLTEPGGQAIAGAKIEIEARESYGGAASAAIGSATTGQQGRFTFHPQKQSASEQLTLTYSPTIGGRPVASQAVRLRVRAGVELHVSPGAVSAGGSIRLTGRILGTPIPSAGKQVVLEARSKGSSWLQFLVLRSGRNGRFTGTHHFRLPGPVRYRFRAVCPEEADFPFATGNSNRVSVWER
jgi:hypothetical protein